MPYLNLEDAQLYYELKGQGPPVLFIQGVGVIGAGWGPQVQELCKDFACLTFDNRGIGQSETSSKKLTVEQMAHDAQYLLDAVGWESAHVVGHSMGGVIAQQLALDAPRRVKSLSLLCTFSKGAEAARLTPWILWVNLRIRIGSRSMRRRAFLEMIFPEEYLATIAVDELASTLAPVMGRDLAEQPPILFKQLKALAAHDCSGRLHELSSIPILVLSAEKDPIALPRYGHHLAQLIESSRYVEVGGASHAVPIQKPEQVNELLRSHFLQID
jgi:pimeloyl-ACP methyl ester carboxylesterase